MLLAWEIARPDGLIEAFGEHHGLLVGVLEATLKKDWPKEFKQSTIVIIIKLMIFFFILLLPAYVFTVFRGRAIE